MPNEFAYEAVDATGESHSGRLIVDREQQVLDYLDERRLVPVSIKRARIRRGGFSLGLFSGAQYEQLIVFTSNLATLLRSGIPILRALSLIKAGKETGSFNQAIAGVRLSMQGGKSLSEALAQYDRLFPQIYLASIAAGEESGNLDSVLDELCSMLESELELSRQIKSGVRYPLIVIGMLGLAIGVLLTFVVPRFVNFYSSFGASLPLPTQILIGVSNFMASYWYILLAAVGLVIYLFHRTAAHPTGRLWLHRKYLKIPIFGDLILKGNVARFAIMFRLMFVSGLPIVRALTVIADSIKNSALGAEVRQLEALFRAGRDTELHTEQFDFMPEMTLQMMSIGLESGSLDKMLAEIGKHFSREVHYVSRHLTAILEPILTLVLGLVVLVLALAIFLPMWNLIQVFRGG